MTLRRLPQRSSSSYAPSIEPDEIIGRTEPRVFTPPLRPLKPAVIDEDGNVVEPATSYGFAVIDFARDVIGSPLDPWEEVAVIRGGELLPNGRPRFRKLLIIVARQNGKTFLLDVLVKYWLYVECRTDVLFTSKSRGKAKEFWSHIISSTRSHPELKGFYEKHKEAAGEEFYRTTDGVVFKFAAPNGDAGRGDSNERVVLDELRQHRNEECWGSAYPSMAAKPHGQLVAITNQGDDKGVVLDGLREAAMTYIRTGKGDHRLGILEWSAPEGSDPLDVEALAMANPNLGHRLDVDDLLSDAKGAVSQGGAKLNEFLTERMCIRIRSFDGAINPDAWEESFVEGDLSHPGLRRVAALDVSMDRRHVTLMAAARLEDGRIRVETKAEWIGPDAITNMRRDLSGHLKGKFTDFGYIPNGPTAAVSADMKKRPGVWPPVGTKLHEVPTSETADICMALAEQVEAGQIVHSSPADDMLTAQITGVVKKRTGAKWFFARPDESNGYADAAYATAVVVHLVRNLPAAPKITKTHALRTV
jgi:hypothetical protein